MTKQFWFNLPVKDVNRAKDFFTKLGFTPNPHYSMPNGASFFIGEQKVNMMIFDEAAFKGFSQAGVANIDLSAEVLFSIDAESKEEVDAMTKKAVELGGSSTHQPSEMQGFMYGSLFRDLDGHRWNVLYMDMSKMPK